MIRAIRATFLIKLISRTFMSNVTLENVLEEAISKAQPIEGKLLAWQMLVNFYDLIYESANVLNYQFVEETWINGKYVREYLKKVTGKENIGRLVANLQTTSKVKSRGSNQELAFYLPNKEELKKIADDSIKVILVEETSIVYTPFRQATYLLEAYMEATKKNKDESIKDIFSNLSDSLLLEISNSEEVYEAMIKLMIIAGETRQSSISKLKEIEKEKMPDKDKDNWFELTYGDYMRDVLCPKIFPEEYIKGFFCDESSYKTEEGVMKSITFQSSLVKLLNQKKVDLKDKFAYSESKIYEKGHYIISNDFSGFVFDYKDRPTNRLLWILTLPVKLLSENNYEPLICERDLRIKTSIINIS